jgi:hypothetical protein
MTRRALYAYHYPAYHRTSSGWFEWDLVRAAAPWFPGHAKPDVPLWGELDDAEPATFVRQARAAAAAGVVGGKIVVAGGAAGDPASLATRLLATVEEVTP